MTWDDSARNGATEKELTDVETDEDKEIVHGKKGTYNSNDTKDHVDKENQGTPKQTTDNNTKGSRHSLNANTPKEGTEKNESRKTNHTVTLVTKRQSASKPATQTQNKEFKDRRQVSKSATCTSRRQSTRSATTSTGPQSRASTARSYRPPSRPRTILGYNPGEQSIFAQLVVIWDIKNYILLLWCYVNGKTDGYIAALGEAKFYIMNLTGRELRNT